MTKQQRAAAVAQCLRDYMKGRELRFQEEESDGTVKFTLTMKGETFSITVRFKVDAEKERIFLFSLMPYSPVKERALELVMAVNDINRCLGVGTFCIDKKYERFTYQYAHSFAGLSGFNSQYAHDVIMVPFQAIDQYIDKLMRLNKGMVGLKEFHRAYKEETWIRFRPRTPLSPV